MMRRTKLRVLTTCVMVLACNTGWSRALGQGDDATEIQTVAFGELKISLNRGGHILPLDNLGHLAKRPSAIRMAIHKIAGLPEDEIDSELLGKVSVVVLLALSARPACTDCTDFLDSACPSRRYIRQRQ